MMTNRKPIHRLDRYFYTSKTLRNNEGYGFVLFCLSNIVDNRINSSIHENQMCYVN